MKSNLVFQQPLVFVDIETTGGSPRSSRILEVGALRVENGRITATYKSLVDPGEPIPFVITELTGISEDDVISAPTFRTISDGLIDIMQGAVFVAHNVYFDYSFLKMEFERIGYTFNPQLLCTVRLSRYLYPGYSHHKLQNIIERFGFQTEHRHRAYDDAEVLWQFVRRAQADFGEKAVELALRHQLKKAAV